MKILIVGGSNNGKFTDDRGNTLVMSKIDYLPSGDSPYTVPKVPHEFYELRAYEIEGVRLHAYVLRGLAQDGFEAHLLALVFKLAPPAPDVPSLSPNAPPVIVFGGGAGGGKSMTHPRPYDTTPQKRRR